MRRDDARLWEIASWLATRVHFVRFVVHSACRPLRSLPLRFLPCRHGVDCIDFDGLVSIVATLDRLETLVSSNIKIISKRIPVLDDFFHETFQHPPLPRFPIGPGMYRYM